MSRKHYIATAAIIRAEMSTSRDASCAEPIARTLRNIALALADEYRKDNPRFDRERFYAACGVEPYVPAGASARAAD